jgi:NDP-sugar pyrophosphorylase family protein
MATPITRAVLLAAGQGSRLRPLTDARPKPMLEVGGRPLIEHTIRQLAAFGVRDIWINLHHCPQAVQDHFGDGRRFGVNMRYSIETELLGTSGGVRRMAEDLKNGGPFFVIYGDNLTTCDLEQLVAVHHRWSPAATIALFWKEDVTPHSAVALDADDRILRFVEKPKAEEAPSHWISAGVNVMEPIVIDYIPEGRASDFGFDVFPALLAADQRLQGYRMSAAEVLWWIDTKEHYDRVAELWKNGTPPIPS